jgi:hypothetical protein
MGTVLHFRTYRAEESNNLKGKVKVERQLVGLPWAADSCPWVGKLRTIGSGGIELAERERERVWRGGYDLTSPECVSNACVERVVVGWLQEGRAVLRVHLRGPALLVATVVRYTALCGCRSSPTL